MDSPMAISPQILAIQRERPPSLAASTRSGKDLLSDRDNIKTVFVPAQVYAFCTSPEHTVTAALANATVDSPVRMIAEHLFGLGYGSFQLFTGEASAAKPQAPKEPNVKGVKAWLSKLNLRPRKAARSAAVTQTPQDDDSSCNVSDDSDGDPTADDHWQKMRPLNEAELAEVLKCGQWRGAQPSSLFLNIYAQALLTLEKNVLNGLVSPPLMGATGVAPLTIISHTIDIVKHYGQMIVNAEREIFFTTNVWEASEASEKIAKAIRELSKKVVDRGGDKIVIKLMYDRGVLPQKGGAHQIVDPSVYSAADVGLPSPDEIPGVRLEVQNYHVPPVGSFHQKSMIIDRKIALLSSNNVQEQGDVGLMVQLEGPIVQSMYDTALLSWWTSLNPPPPLLYQTPSYSNKLDRSSFQFGRNHPAISAKGDFDAIAAKSMRRLSINPLPLAAVKSDAASPDGSASPPLLSPAPVPSLERSQSNGSTSGFTPILVHEPHDPFPIALVNRTPRGRRGQGDTFVPQNQAWMAGFKFAKKSIFIQTPTFSAKPVVAAALDAVRRGVLVEIYADLGFNEQGELSPDGAANQAVAAYMYAQLAEEYRANLRIYWYIAKGETSPQTSHTCHIKMMIIDEQVAVQGNGRQDMSSWYHAQEINILVDSAQIASDWRRTLDTNQDTRLHGRVGHDGIWRGSNGKPLPLPLPAPGVSPVIPARNPSMTRQQSPRRTSLARSPSSLSPIARTHTPA